MNDAQILAGVKRYFKIYELVGERTYLKFGLLAWRFLDVRLLWAILIIRENLGKPMTINNWRQGGNLDERGLRTNVQDILKDKTKKDSLYLSAHILGKAVDFDVKGMTAENVRQWILDNHDLFPFKIRLEKDVSWCHLDVIQDETKPSIYLFKP